MLMSNPAPPTQAAPNYPGCSPFRRQVKHILREGVQSLEEGYEDDPFTEQLLGVIEKHKHLPE